MTRVLMAVELRFMRVRMRWTLREGRQLLVPEVESSIAEGTDSELIEDAWGLRNEFFRMKHTEKDALEFLNRVGVWRAVEEPDSTRAQFANTVMAGAYGHRMFFGRALPLTLEELWRDQAYWIRLLRERVLLKTEFGPPPAMSAAPYEKFGFAANATASNLLPLSIEWSAGSKREPAAPRGVIETITGCELLIATTQVDLLTDAPFQICQRPDCGIPFTGRQRMFCNWYCGHITSVRKQRAQKKGRKNHGKRR